MSAPVLFLVFNRPDTTQRVFDAIRLARPPRLYVAADGPRHGREGEAERCAEVRRMATAVDWDCEVHTLFREENLGCRRAIGTALDWFFAAEECGIVLEDDCLPSVSWFPFAQEMLERYRDDERIMCISATRFCGDAQRAAYSYSFSIYAHCWGWASWRRAWMHYDRNKRDWPALREAGLLQRLGNGNPRFVRYWERVFDTVRAGEQVDSWAYRWLFSCWANNALTVLPARNLVVNIGLGPEATHTHSVNSVVAGLRNEELAFPLLHPPSVVCDADLDEWENRHVFGMTWANEFRQRLRSIPLLVSLIRALRKLQAGEKAGEGNK